jgi:putative Mn2+ efflux pump MntP
VGLITTLGIALGLAMDAFAVSLAAGAILGRVSGRQTFRLSFHFGLFQFLMPVIGWLAGRTVSGLIAAYDHWIAFALLCFIGGRMIHTAWRGDAQAYRGDPTKGLTMVALSVATSIDALAVGLSLAMLRVTIWTPSVIIGLVAAAMTAIGMHLGSQAGSRLGRRVEALGGLTLIGIGLKILIEHFPR